MTTETTEMPRSIAAMMKENPRAYDFDDIKGEPMRGSVETEGQTYTMAQMLGEFERIKQDQVSGLVFWGRKPKINGLRKFIELADAPISTEDLTGLAVVDAMMERLCALASLVLFIQDDRAGWRPATILEIGDAFEMQELRDLTDKFSGLKKAEGDEGNAQSLPTTP